MPRKSEPQSTGSALSETRKKNTTAPKKKQSCCDNKTVFLAASMIESAYQTTVRCAPIDEERFKDNYKVLENLYESLKNLHKATD